MSIQPPQRSSTKASLREFGRGVRDGVKNVRGELSDFSDSIKRRMSSSLSHETQQKKRPKVIRRVSVMGHKAAEKMTDFVGRFSPRHSSSVEQSGQQYSYSESQYQPTPAVYEIPQNSTTHVMFANEAGSNPAYCQDGTFLQGSQDQGGWPMSAIPSTQLEHNIANSPPTSTQQTATFPWAPVQEDVNMSTYPPETWHQATTSTPSTREQLLGGHSRTPPPDLNVVEGPLRELNQFSASVLRGTHKNRFKRTVNTANELGTLITGSPMDQCLSPADVHSNSLSPITASPSTPVDNRRRGSASSGAQSYLEGDDDVDGGHQPCPWPQCPGTAKSQRFESNRLKEHIRRMHLLPFMCDTEGCNVRKGDKHQIYRHRTSKHPNEPEKRCKEQDQDPVALKKYKALNERGLSYARIAEICKAETLDDLEEPWERKARATSSQALKTESPISPTTNIGLGLHQNLNYSPQPSHRNSTSFVDAATHTPPYNSPTFAPVDSTAVLNNIEPACQEFVNTVLAPHLDALQLRNSTRENRKEQLSQMIMDRLAIMLDHEMDRLERRRSTVSNGTMHQSYTDMLSSPQGLEVPPALTTANTHSSVSQGSLPGYQSAFVNIQESPSSERFPWPQQQQTTAQQIQGDQKVQDGVYLGQEYAFGVPGEWAHHHHGQM